MVIINKSNIAVLVFFIASFILFLFLIEKGTITGMVAIDPSTNTNQTTYFYNSIIGGPIKLNMVASEVLPSDAVVNVTISNATISTNDDLGMYSKTKALSTIIIDITAGVGTTSDGDDSIRNGWEDKSLTSTALLFTAAKSYDLDFKDFNVNTPNLPVGSKAKDYKVDVKVNWLCPAAICTQDTGYDLTSLYSKTITARSNNVSFINNIQLTNITGGNRFRINDYINCTATIIDVNKDEPTFNATFWGPSKSYKRTNGNKEECTGTSWDNNGKTCSVSAQITASDIVKNSDIGFWNCSISVFDGYGVNMSLNSSNIFTMNNTPVIFVGKFNNQSWYNNSRKDNVFSLISSSPTGDGFYDPDSTLDFFVIGNKSMNVTIDSNYLVSFVGRNKSFVGKENITFNATDGFSSALSNNITLNVSLYVSAACPTCSQPSAWSTCAVNSTGQYSYSRTNYRCGSTTNYLCQSYTENQACTPASTLPPPPPPLTTPPAAPSTGGQELGVGAEEKAAQVTGPKEESKAVKTLLVGSGIFILIAGLGIGGYFLINYLKNRPRQPAFSLQPATVGEIKGQKPIPMMQMKKEEAVSAINLQELRDYITNALKNKMPIAVIKDNLLKAGWKQEQIQRELDLVNLRIYIQSKLDQGVRKEEIKQGLKLKGWKENMIEEAFSGLSAKPLF